MDRSDVVAIIQPLLSSGLVEDVDRELELSIYHLFKNGDCNTEELNRIVDGIYKGYPVYRTIGYTQYNGCVIEMTSDVLHPGPETVTLGESIVSFIKQRSCRQTVLDLCIGSGALGIYVAKTSNSEVTAVDISRKALDVAQKNAEENNVHIDFLLGDLFVPVYGKSFDVIVCNPPYVKSLDVSKLPRYIKDFTPRIAIDGGADGLLFHRKVLENAQHHCAGSGRLFIEFEDGQDKRNGSIAWKHLII